MLWKSKCLLTTEKQNNLTQDIECNSYTGHDLDKELCDVIDTNINSMIPWFIMATYAQKEENDPILSGIMYDRLARKIIDHWKEIDHEYKIFLALHTTAKSVYINEYPPRVRGGVEQLRGAYKIGAKYRN